MTRAFGVIVADGSVSIEADDDERGVVSQATGEMTVKDPGNVFG